MTEEAAKNLEKLEPKRKTTIKDLMEVLRTAQRGERQLPGFDPDTDDIDHFRQNINCDEIIPGVYIGDGFTAMNKKYLQRIGITHVLNCAEGKDMGMVNTNKIFYSDTTIKYLGFHMFDMPETNISQFFNDAAAFIENAITSGGKVFVHCVLGVSRSATCVIAYLMIKKGMPATEATRIVKENRSIYPNEGFLQQLVALDNQRL